jgi:predicted signal transduction protein with EAL and GGDEF domain
MRHFARARATSGTTRIGWLFMASVGTGAALWASTFISILALDPSLDSGFEPVATGAVLLVAIVACLAGFEIGSRHFTLAPEAGGLIMGAGILAMHGIAFRGWHIAGVFAQPFQVQDQQLALSASIGFSIFPIDTPERDQVVSNAKLAMHRGKSQQRGLICQYHREMDDTARARRALARDLQMAAVRGELELHYQLQTTLATGKSAAPRR